MSLQLTKPLAFIDLETTGINIANDRIVEIFILKVLPDGTQQKKHKLLNPGMPIPPESSAIHGITDDKVKDAPTFKEVANELKQFLENADLSGFNSNRFDIPLLVEEFLRAGITFDLSNVRMIDVQHIFHTMEKRTLSAAYKFYCGKDLEDAHSAEADTMATFEVLQAQVERYKQLGNNVDSILDFIGEEKIVDFARRIVYDEKGNEVFNFGKHKGRKVKDVLNTERQYYDWMMKGEFPLHTKQKMTEILNRTLLTKK
ncbi:MAG: 3'-5' exonuclease [Chitinophagaceae bacterium]|nr:3'-5' exonuclease [Chitinophagaceae bacterium]